MLITHLHQVAQLTLGDIPPLPQLVMARSLVKHRDTFTLILPYLYHLARDNYSNKKRGGGGISTKLMIIHKKKLKNN
jgi:hypothetical protein